MKRVLFVDDEPRVLGGLRRMLRSRLGAWRMEFAGSGREALDTMATQPFDVLVADMRMPGMTGMELLDEVRRLYPCTVRIVLSGQADEGAILCTLGAVHQYLPKPCDAKTFQSVLARAGALREYIANDQLAGLVSQMKTLPSPPALRRQMEQELDSIAPSASAVGKILSLDMGMMAKVLQLSRFPLFGRHARFPSPSETAAIVGLETIRSLALSGQLSSHLDATRLSAWPLKTLWSHSVKVGKLARKISRSEKDDPQQAEEAFAAGLLHDVGKLVLAVHFPQEYGSAPRIAANEGTGLDAAERQLFGTSHAEVGAYLLGLWGLPAPIVAAVALHHSPTRIEAHRSGPAAAVHAANTLPHDASLCGNAGGASVAFTDLASIDVTEQFSVWQRACRQTRNERNMTDD